MKQSWRVLAVCAVPSTIFWEAYGDPVGLRDEDRGMLGFFTTLALVGVYQAVWRMRIARSAPPPPDEAEAGPEGC